jgi:quinol monooxygenase YgiN
MEIVVHTTLTWDNADLESARGYMAAQERATREMQGCLACHWTADLEDPCVFYEFERWESEQAFAGHASNGPKFAQDARDLIRRARTFRFDIASHSKLH